ncbi:MAG: serine hydrolase [Chitinophagaceae bacterium]|nr:serine hydrolase [Chitinophagaceae bacterium]
MKKIPFAVFIIFLFSKCHAQLPPGVEAKIDSVFQQWNNAGSPGAAVAIVKDGKTIFTKGYGIANLEYGIPITPASVFHIASESKKYTAFSIALLAKQGKLSLDDDIRKYLPYVQDFRKKITIRHLISHTSGLRDQWQSLVIAGGQMDDVISQDHVIKFVSQQKELNFDPGERMLYCNTGYTLLAEIVKKASGQSLRAFTEQNIFKPLKMTNAHFNDNYTEIVKNRVNSYYPAGIGRYSNSVLSYSTVGATSLLTTVEDEAKWLINYENMQVGSKELFDQVFETSVLNNGNKTEYGFGVFINNYKGHKRIGHGGADAGFRSYSCYYPNDRLGIVIFSNLGVMNPTGLSEKIADIMFGDKNSETKPGNTSNGDTASFKYFTGSYLSPEMGSLGVVEKNTRLFLQLGGGEFPMSYEKEKTYSLFDGFFSIRFDRAAAGKSTGMEIKSFGSTLYAKRFTPASLNERDLDAYTGTYYSDELDATYYIVKENGQLLLRHRKHPDGTLRPITASQFSSSNWWMDNLLFNTDTGGKITGFEVNAQRVLHLKFKKIK